MSERRLTGERGGESMMSVRGLTVRYGRATEALHDVSIEVPGEGIVAVLGSNGAGKSTLLKAISGALDREGGRIVAGSIVLDGVPITRLACAGRVRKGVVHVPEGRRIFPRLSVLENLRAGGMGNPNARAKRDALRQVFEMFPVLAERRQQTATLLSGGEQQMLAIGRGFMAGPRLLLLDEPSLGLAPKIVDRIAQAIKEISRRGTAIVLVEQNASIALGLARHATVMELGRVALAGSAADLRAHDAVRSLYLGDPVAKPDNGLVDDGMRTP